MKSYSSDCVSLSNFDHEIEFGNLITGSDYVWLVNKRSACLQIKNIKDKSEMPINFNFDLVFNEKNTIVCGKEFEYNQQLYLLVSLEFNSTRTYLLALFQITTSKVLFSFQVPNKVTALDVIVKNRHFIDSIKNPGILRNFDVTAACGCDGGAFYLFDVTPYTDYASLDSNEKLNVFWHKNSEYEDYDESVITEERLLASNGNQIFGLFMNYKSFKNNTFTFKMPNHEIAPPVSTSIIKVTSIKYEKLINSVIVGFNVGCFQLWNLRMMKIETSSGFGENTRPVVGFSLIESHNEKRKSLFLIVCHDTEEFKIITNKENKMRTNDSSLILMFQLFYDKTVSLSINNNESYDLYEKTYANSIMAFSHDLTLDTLKYVQTSYLSEKNKHISNFNEFNQVGKVISVQTLNTKQVDYVCIFWTLFDRYETLTAKYYLLIFNINNWYLRNKPEELIPKNDSKGAFINKNDNNYFTNFSIPLNEDVSNIKVMSIVDSKLKKQFDKNGHQYSNGQSIVLSMNMDIFVMTPFAMQILNIKSIENDAFSNKINQDITNVDFPVLKRTLEMPHTVSVFKRQRTSPILKNLSNRLIETFEEARTVCYKEVDSNNNPSYLKMLDTNTVFTKRKLLKTKSYSLKQLNFIDFNKEQRSDSRKLINGNVDRFLNSSPTIDYTKKEKILNKNSFSVPIDTSSIKITFLKQSKPAEQIESITISDSLDMSETYEDLDYTEIRREAIGRNLLNEFQKCEISKVELNTSLIVIDTNKKIDLNIEKTNLDIQPQIEPANDTSKMPRISDIFDYTSSDASLNLTFNMVQSQSPNNPLKQQQSMITEINETTNISLNQEKASNEKNKPKRQKRKSDQISQVVSSEGPMTRSRARALKQLENGVIKDSAADKPTTSKTLNAKKNKSKISITNLKKHNEEIEKIVAIANSTVQESDNEEQSVDLNSNRTKSNQSVSSTATTSTNSNASVERYIGRGKKKSKQNETSINSQASILSNVSVDISTGKTKRQKRIISTENVPNPYNLRPRSKSSQKK